MLFTKDEHGNLRAFSFGTDEEDLDQIKDNIGVQACKMALASEGIIPQHDAPVLKLIQGGKAV